ncbi:cAMP-binding domain of CRP or a regulatory subunit of cAMP-dependent protein kinases [Salegentibacter holothuriorum]|uniref:cAMP-binding domain of CRP or a regulatory subunit of cAMP-dependent protein kinases n=1 Tax=Salegentibacter holothuriorum TaxID=241145 RepID=A0A1T5AN05_9FLAO|nr:Crp/Fnr family transcriptional regulator [Salegentibacter holothuriorum]SKB36220.1 cAMP-binding domain of CRP or a regulatory subunit of cAMP-dependent protein kinases [Salegentibacter holothuriorum]
MKHILLFSKQDFKFFKSEEFSVLKNCSYSHVHCLEKLSSSLVKNEPDLIICGTNSKIPPVALKRNQELSTIPLISIITEENLNNWLPLHSQNHYLLNSHSQAELLYKIESLLSSKNKNTQRIKIPDIESLKKYIEEEGETVFWDKNKIIFRENRHSSFIYLISKGLVKTSRMDQLGKELITGIYRKNELLGLYGFHENPICPETAATIEPSRVHRILYKDFKEILQENQELSLDLAQHLTDTVLRLKSQLLEMAYASVLKKTSNTILQFADDLQNPDFPGLKISRTDLASIAGISTESFIRSLSCLKKEGIIAIKGKKINILNPERLQDIV